MGWSRASCAISSEDGIWVANSGSFHLIDKKNMSKISPVPRVLQPASLADKAYHAIRDLIVSLELPPGAVIDERELARLSEVRAVLEPEAARLAAERATAADRAALGELLDELDAGDGDERELIALDERVHRAIYRAAHNDLLEATLEQYYVLALRIWVMALDRTRELEEAVEAHRALLEAG